MISSTFDPGASGTHPGTPAAGHAAPGTVGASPGDSAHALPRPRDPVSGPHPEIPPGEPLASDSMVGTPQVDPNAPSPAPHPRLATSPSLRTLPSVVPFRAPVRGDMIRNGSVGVYFMGEYIGGGSYGDVYECTDEWSNPLVAKVLKAAASFEEVRRQWESEVANLSRMRHPNITYIHDAFFYDNAFYIIVEKCLYSLDRVLPRIDESWLPHIARDVLQALAFIHRHGHVHKDVHPGNVFVSLTSDVMDAGHGPRVSFKLGDLGITRVETDIRMVGTIMAPWMLPPEAVDPATYGTVGRPTDVYHTALLLLSVLRREVPSFTEAEILAGAPLEVAQRLGSPYSAALVNALRPRVMHRTQTPLEFWREVQAALQYVS
ncbi:MAG: protein kinase [Myxococcota bacterium]